MRYKGFIIEKENDLWPMKYGSKFKFHREEEEVVYSAESLEEAKDCVDEQIEKDFTDEFGCIDHSALNIAERYWKNEQLIKQLE